jgi:adenosine deaminase
VAPTGPRRDRVRARDARRVQVGDQDVDLVAVEQVLDAAHAATVGHALRFARAHLTDGRRDVRQVLDALDAILDDEGVEALSPRNHPDGTLVRPRRHEIAAALSRAPG